MKILTPIIGLCLATSASAAVSVSIGLNDNGSFRFINNSTAGESILSVALSFSDDTFFDTDPLSPGTASTAFSGVNNVGDTTIVLPNSTDTDGESSATFAFFGNEPGDDISIFFDLDASSAIDGSGDASAAVFELLVVEGGNTATYVFSPTGPGTVGGQAFSQVFSPVPEISSLLLSALGGGLLALRRKRS